MHLSSGSIDNRRMYAEFKVGKASWVAWLGRSLETIENKDTRAHAARRTRADCQDLLLHGDIEGLRIR